MSFAGSRHTGQKWLETSHSLGGSRCTISFAVAFCASWHSHVRDRSRLYCLFMYASMKYFAIAGVQRGIARGFNTFRIPPAHPPHPRTVPVVRVFLRCECVRSSPSWVTQDGLERTHSQRRKTRHRYMGASTERRKLAQRRTGVHNRPTRPVWSSRHPAAQLHHTLACHSSTQTEMGKRVVFPHDTRLCR